MAFKFTCSKKAIEKTLNQMKNEGRISEDAYFNHKKEKYFKRREVAYHDIDFLEYLAHHSEEEIVDELLDMLKVRGYIENEIYNKKDFKILRDEINRHFKVKLDPNYIAIYLPAISPVMERTLYALSTIKKPGKSICIGTFCGSIMWNICSNYISEKSVIGIEDDCNKERINIIKEYIGTSDYMNKVELIQGDLFEVVNNLEGTFDYVFLDIDCTGRRKDQYLDVLKILYDKINIGGWVLAHDTTFWFPPVKNKLKDYLDFVRNKNNFSESISLDIDYVGLELSIK